MVNKEVLDFYNRSVPRYTSYPTAPHFHAGIDAKTYAGWLGDLRDHSKLSLYIHIPFCDRLCWFCGCTTKQTHKYKPIANYLKPLRQEIINTAKAVDGTSIVTALHFGGGSPSMLTPDDLRALNAHLRQHFNFAADAEISFEIDPNDMDETRYDAMADIGVTRASLGVQDFDEKVQKAINREQSYAQTKQVIAGLRARGINAINLDVLYGLPFQTHETMRDTINKVVSLSPDRVALFGYAHVPWMKKHQRLIDKNALPNLEERFAQAELASDMLRISAFTQIGIDHFARPGDSLSQAACTGTLRRNFQGYTTDAADALIGLGASSISQLPQGYVQNSPASADYAARIEAQEFATIKGVARSQEDQMRAYVIESIMCNFELNCADLRAKFGAHAAVIFDEADYLVASEPNQFFRFEAGDYLVPPAGRYYIPLAGRPFVRTFAAHFDCYLNQGTARHSIAV